MAWEMYAIIVVLVAWAIHSTIKNSSERMGYLKDIFYKTKSPILIETGYIYNNIIKFKYANCSELGVIGFELVIVVHNTVTNTFDYVPHFIELTYPNELKPYNSKNIKIEAELLDVKKQKIEKIYVSKVLYDNGAVWKNK